MQSSALNRNLLSVSYRKVCKKYTTECQDVLTAITEKKHNILEELNTQLNRLKGIKWYIAVQVKFIKIFNNEEVVTKPFFHGKTRALLPSDNVEEQFLEALDKILENMAKWVCEGSGWTLESVEQIDLCIVKYKPLHASSFIPTPKKIANAKQGIINIKNDDNKCFLWSVIAALYPDKHQHNRINYFKSFERLINMTGIEYPVKVTDISKFEKLNPTISVNALGYENDEIYPLRVTKERGRVHHINLLLLTTDTGNSHYCLISNLNHLLSSLTKHKEAAHYCNYCLHRFRNEKTLIEHEPLCTPHGVQKTKLPEENDKWMKFTNYSLCHKVPFTIYCDFESYTVPMESEPELTNSKSNKKEKYTTNIAKHIPSGYCYVIVSDEGRAIKRPKIYTGPNVVDHFLNSLMDEANELLPIIKTNNPMKMTQEDEINFNNATTCHLCHKPLNDSKVRNHNHLNGQFLGAAHYDCNINYKVPQHIPVFFHNLKGYDCHHLIQGFGKFKEEKMSCIAKSSEQYISVTLESLGFLDSLQFMNKSLETLVNNLAEEGSSNFHILKQCMGEEHLDLLLRKGVFPYTWLSDPSKLQETCLPPRYNFFNDLTEEPIKEEDYHHAQNVWTSFNMQTMKDYHNLYLMTDVLLLADVFENFRNTSLQYYEIDPCNVYSAPGLAWNSMLKMSDVTLELLTDIDKHLFIEKGIRGGVAMIPHRYATANNPQVSGYDPSKPNEYLLYLDCNNLYGTAMTQPLPYAEFNWLSNEEIQSIDFSTVPDDANTGFILEVDLEYPDHLHDLHNDYPLAPERKEVEYNMLSPYSKQLIDELKLKPAKVDKLLTTLNDKEKYVLHYRNLKLYLNLGLQLKKIHRVLSFKQSPWLAPFIHFNTEKRMNAKNEFEKEFFKLINNATYGKSMENVRSRIDFKLVANEKKLIKWTANPRLTNFFAYNEDLVGVCLKKQTILLNKPIYVGMTVLDISKLIMYDFHYNYIKRKYGNKARLCMTDTDSLFYHIITPNVYEDIRNDLHLFDTSDYPKDHPCYSPVNKKKLGKFKDEAKGQPPHEIVGLRAKCYSILESEIKEKKIAKGVPRVAIKNKLRHEMYRKCLLNHILYRTPALNIISHHHQLYTQEIEKLSLNPYDDKRYILNDGIHTLPYGHYNVKKSCEDEPPPPPPKRRRTEL